MALTKQNPKILFGQTIKGRYYITDLLREDASSFVYLADDKIIANKQVIFRVLLDEKKDDFLSKILAEERVSLSHINHPNVAHLIDSGELLEGNPFIVSEYVDGFSLDEKLQILDNFSPLRTARIIRQASYALSEVHQNGILHRGLKPENIFLTVSEAGTEQVKVTDFVVTNFLNKQSLESLRYVSPEQLEGKLPNFASDIFSLAVIAFQMLTGRQPFNFSTADQLLKAQKEGLKMRASNLRLDISPTVDEVLEKALSYSPSDRYPKARDFGDALYNALTATSTVTKSAESESLLLKKDDAIVSNSILVPALKEADPIAPENRISFEAKSELVEEKAKSHISLDGRKVNDLWEKRSPDPIKIPSYPVLVLIVLGLVLFFASIWGIWHYFLNRPQQPVFVPTKSDAASTQNPGQNDADVEPTQPINNEGIESVPPPRNIPQPPNTEYFQNTKAALKGDLAKNYRGFSLYYPKTWTKNQSETNFVDLSKNNSEGLPVEMFLVQNYESKGTFKLDKNQFPEFVKSSSKKLAKSLTNFKLISEGETNVNRDWKAYEMKFQGDRTAKNGQSITFWGRCLYIPAATRGVKSGFLVTMIGTSLSPDVKSADDIGNKGELGNILETFEPASLE